jgi:hypothetical protein
MKEIIVLILLNVCHWAGDYTHLSTRKMLDAKRFGTPIAPIFTHALVHGFLFFVVLFYVYDIDRAILGAILQLTTHFAIDLLKGKINLWFKSVQSPANKSHWYVFGADQFMHQLVLIVTVLMLCK